MPGNIFHFIMQNTNENKDSTAPKKNNKDLEKNTSLDTKISFENNRNIFDYSNMKNRYDLNNKKNNSNLLQQIINCFESESIIDIIN